MLARSYYASSHWRHLAREAKERDNHQCQICGDCKGDPYCQLHAHHIVRRLRGGSDRLENLITICDLCHAVVTRWWYWMWFARATAPQKKELEDCRTEFEQFLGLPQRKRRIARRDVWRVFGIRPAKAG